MSGGPFFFNFNKWFLTQKIVKIIRVRGEKWVRGCGAAFVFAGIMHFLSSGVLAESLCGQLIFYDDFSGKLEQKWSSFGKPSPRVHPYRGRPSPAFDNNGDEKSNNGVISKRCFKLQPGMVIRCDMFVPSNPAGCWIGGSFGFPRNPEHFRSGVWPDWLIGMSYDYIGDLCWGKKIAREEGTLTCRLIDEDGQLEIFRRPFCNRYLDAWHTYGIIIKNDGFVEFRVDGELIYYSRRRMSYEHNHLPLMLGHRSSRYGKVYHDNVGVYAYKKETKIP